MIDAILEQLKNKRILILGFGKEGKSSLRFIVKHELSKQIGIADLNPIDANELHANMDISIYCGQNYLDAIAKYDIILKTPGIKTDQLKLHPKQLLSSQTDLFLQAFHQQTIGITGTKGKSTTTSLVHHILVTAGKNCLITGNIGIPCFDSVSSVKPHTWVVFELSAHQLEHIHRSPHIAVLLNLFEEHLDHFGSIEAYFHAKKNIYAKAGETDILIAHKSLQQMTESFTGKTLFFPMEMFSINAANPLPGSHNLLNIQAAILCATEAGIPVQESLASLQSFRPLPHRLEYIGQFDGVKFYNDSIATITEATILALQTLDQVDWLLLGGFDRGINYMPLAEQLLSHPIQHILVTGKAGMRMMHLLQDNGYQGNLHTFKTLREAFEMMAEQSQPGEVCLLSPAAASYDSYKNFEQRGAMFAELSRNFKRKRSSQGA